MKLDTALTAISLSLLPVLGVAHPSHAGNAQHFLEHLLIAGLFAVPMFFVIRRLHARRDAVRVRVRKD
ncbi:MAG: hypothetical protein H6926_04560 [Chromatiales bacterium]|nr:hypothetical protein [Gammaproteobacteria bacterium]MCP5231097.1 hypothetical protein [Zoogloeaceae bacterium]MCP5352447.1 hypothetical protein [Chromatiales bacterium]